MIAMKSREFFVCVLLYRAIRKAYIIKAKKRSPSNSKAGGEQKKCPGRWLVSCSGTLLMLDDKVVDKLFGF